MARKTLSILVALSLIQRWLVQADLLPPRPPPSESTTGEPDAGGAPQQGNEEASLSQGWAAEIASHQAAGVDDRQLRGVEAASMAGTAIGVIALARGLGH
eukprot:TRINITY_DN16369_c0_g1_i1.p1 TRINITY_DN16369_c0_g1~~TRINITY_DN16369_c0_g1_i1.p1  ORF type:complete len:100 (+),score=17.13 TRINITY_DN16369_c0_g1_i1:75-374(+)